MTEYFGLLRNYWSLAYSAFGLHQDGNVGVGVFPNREEILVSGTGLGGVAFQSGHAGEAETRECACRTTPNPVVQLDLKDFCFTMRLIRENSPHATRYR
jgi:hypothetical protein